MAAPIASLSPTRQAPSSTVALDNLTRLESLPGKPGCDPEVRPHRNMALGDLPLDHLRILDDRRLGKTPEVNE